MPYFATRDKCKLFYRIHRIDTAHPVVIFLNGTTQTTMYWGSHVPAFSRRCRLLCYDARCQGQSETGTAPISLPLHVSDLYHLSAHLGIGKAHLIGLSHGARVALEFAVEFPQMVEKLVLCSISARTSDRCKAFVRSWLEILNLSGLRAMAWAAVPTVFGNRFLKHHQKTLDKIVNAVVLRNSKKALAAQLEALLRYPQADGIPADFNIPTLIVSGSEDPLVDADDIRQLADRCKAHHAQLEGIGHSVPAEAPELFQQMVLAFLKDNS
ncbi:MAG: alpha/beta hydrolase [Desulfobacterales bacterium]